jgi:hypothetical protein
MSKTGLWAGRVISALVALFLAVDGAGALLNPGAMAGEFAKTGFTLPIGTAIGWIPLVCAIVYAVPRTAVLGAILVTAFLGGAICVHVRIGEPLSPPVFICVVVGVLAWTGLWLRDARVRALLPVSS